MRPTMKFCGMIWLVSWNTVVRFFGLVTELLSNDWPQIEELEEPASAVYRDILLFSIFR